eukprot:1220968-Amphidinium_carterae.1
MSCEETSASPSLSNARCGTYNASAFLRFSSTRPNLSKCLGHCFTICHDMCSKRTASPIT